MGNRHSGSRFIYDALTLRAGARQNSELQALVHAARQIAEAMPLSSSIDSFLETRRGDERMELCGKLAIIEAICAAERASTLFTDPRRPDLRPDQLQIQGTWFNGFWQIFTEGCPRADLEDRAASIAFINFNYDRCVERFLYFALQDFYAMNAQEAAHFAQQVRVYHPYGMVGPLPWMRLEGSMEYGAEVTGAGLLAAAPRIKTFSEGTDEGSSEITQIRRALNEASRIVFLGFAFHPQNLALLWPDRTKTPDQYPDAFATVLGISESDVQFIRSDLASALDVPLPDPARFKNIECYQLFHQFKRSLKLVR
jgi:hypothetical protein